ncbi:MAG: hypothetical protein V4441_01285 [Pseudomonadota bacterium]
MNMMRLLGLVLLSLLLAACAGSGSGSVLSTGIGMKDAELSSLEPAPSIGSGPLTPHSLLGVAPSALSARLGPPALKRTEPDAEVWQYSGSDCALFVYFYKAGHGALASTYVDARKSSGGPASTDVCLADIASGHGVPTS